jgi:hypothetical protein
MFETTTAATSETGGKGEPIILASKSLIALINQPLFLA